MRKTGVAFQCLILLGAILGMGGCTFLKSDDVGSRKITESGGTGDPKEVASRGESPSVGVIEMKKYESEKDPWDDASASSGSTSDPLGPRGAKLPKPKPKPRQGQAAWDLESNPRQGVRTPSGDFDEGIYENSGGMDSPRGLRLNVPPPSNSYSRDSLVDRTGDRIGGPGSSSRRFGPPPIYSSGSRFDAPSGLSLGPPPSTDPLLVSRAVGPSALSERRGQINPPPEPMRGQPLDRTGVSGISSASAVPRSIPTARTSSPPSPTETAVPQVDPETLREIGISQYKNKNYEGAALTFQDYLSAGYSDPDQTVQWRLAQSLYESQHWGRASEEFNKLRTSPHPENRADAIYKLGLIDKKQGDIETARVRWKQVVEKYPGTRASRRAAAEIAAESSLP